MYMKICQRFFMSSIIKFLHNVFTYKTPLIFPIVVSTSKMVNEFNRIGSQLGVKKIVDVVDIKVCTLKGIHTSCYYCSLDWGWAIYIYIILYSNFI